VRLLVDGARLQSAASAVRDDAVGLTQGARRIEEAAAEGAGAAGHPHVGDGLHHVADYHARYVRVLAVAAEALASEIAEFDACMAAVDHELTAGR
jgi:hypothetical protein